MAGGISVIIPRESKRETSTATIISSKGAIGQEVAVSRSCICIIRLLTVKPVRIRRAAAVGALVNC